MKLTCFPGLVAGVVIGLSASGAMADGYATEFEALVPEHGRVGALDVMAVDLLEDPEPGLEDRDLPFARTYLACRISLDNTPREICLCLADTASNEYDEVGHELVAAVMIGDQSRVDELRGEVPLDTFLGAATFLVNAPVSCAG